MKKQILFYDIEVIGTDKPVFLVCVRNQKTRETFSFWEHRRGHMSKLLAMLDDPKYTWVSFNGIKFDAPLLAAMAAGHDSMNLKTIASKSIEDNMMPWDVYDFAECEALKFDHIDLFEVAPGVRTSLKTYSGRMFLKSIIDMPFHHDQDLTPKQQIVLNEYCLNDLDATETLFNMIAEERQLREEMSAEYEIDLRSKSDAQIAEAILKKAAGISGKQQMPAMVQYITPVFIKTSSVELADLIDELEMEHFKIDHMSGSPQLPEWLEEPISINDGLYQVGIGGLHSKHDIKFFTEASDNWMISDFDVASYYPSIILLCGYTPRLGSNKGDLFIEAYKEIYNTRLEAKAGGNKKVANSLKIVLNGTYGKLGSKYCSFYSPDLMIATTITGQLNLLTLIDDIEQTTGVKVLSANTDGIVVGYHPKLRNKVLKTIDANARRTGLVYEEKLYKTLAMKDVNNYIAIDTNGEVKAKGLYATPGLMKNPTMLVCSQAATQYLLDGTKPEVFINKAARSKRNFINFTAIRAVQGGGVQHQRYMMVDDWENVEHKLWYSPTTDKKEKRVSRPKPQAVGVDGKPFGRVARWYMTTDTLPSITYVGSGNQVPKTEGAKLCMILPDAMPKDLNKQWYIDETYSILKDIGAIK